MRLFFDTNVWVSAMVARGLCLDLLHNVLDRLDSPGYALLLSTPVREETRRILTRKLGASPVQMDLVEQLWRFATQGECPSALPVPADFPDPDDWPILCAAAHASADAFVTGDKALLALVQFEGVPIVDPRTAYLRLRRLS